MIAAGLLASARVERNSLELFVPPKHLRLDPTDVVEVEQTSEALTTTLRARLVETTLDAGGVIRCRGALQDAGLRPERRRRRHHRLRARHPALPVERAGAWRAGR